MRTHVIQLEPHDDLVSIRDKMSWAKAPRILLVWKPRRRKLALTEIDLTLLRRHASSLGADVGLVTSQRTLRRVAEHAGIPVYGTTAEAQRASLVVSEAAPTSNRSRGSDDRILAEARRRRKSLELRRLAAAQARPSAWASSRPARVGFFVLGVGSLLLLGCIFIPSAEVEVEPATMTQSLILPVSASPYVEAVELAAIPARTLTLSLSGRDSLAASGDLLVPQSFAHGRFRLTNQTDDAVTVPAGTVLVAGTDSPRRFVTSTRILVPPGVGQTVEVGVRALQGGLAGNIAAGSVLAFEGPLGLRLSATTAAALIGGADHRQSAPTEDDRSELYARLSALLAQQALARARTLAADDVFIDTVVASKTIREDYSPAAGQPGRMITLDLAQDFDVIYVSHEDLQKLARAALDAALPSGYEPADADVDLTLISDPATDIDGMTHWEMRASRLIRAALSPGEIIARIQGESAVRAQLALRGLLLKGTPVIRIYPAWFPLLPLIPLRISVDTGS